MKLILKRFGKIIEERHLEEGVEYLVGRHKDCDFVLNEGEGLSRKHLKIYQSGETGNWIIESLSDLGGLYLEGEEVDGAEMEAESSFSLKNYVLEFKTEQKSAENDASVPATVPTQGQQDLPAKNNGENLAEETIAGGETQFLAQPHLLYSLYIYIQGEFSDHIRLNDKTSWTVGRAKACDISIDYNILTRKHLKIFNRDGAFYVEDLNSANKTFVNGQELAPHKSVLLRANDKISVSDLKIIFEVRNQNLEKMMSQMPAPSDDDKEDSLPAMAMPKVILEDTPEESPRAVFKKKPALVKKVLLCLAALAILGPVLYFKYKEDKKKEVEIAQKQKEKEQQNQWELLYEDALKSREQAQYNFCITQLNDLHRSFGGPFKDSKGILSQCHLGQESQQKIEERKAQEEQESQTAEKIKKIVDTCKKAFAEGKIQTEQELDKCADELISGLDPINTDIAAIRTKITEKENLKSLQAEKQEALRQQIQAKKALYNKAVRLQKQEKPLKAVSAYNVFLKSVKNFASLKKLKAKALTERDDILAKYNNRLNALHDSCDNLIKVGKMKEAYYDCKKVLEFKNDDTKAQQAIKEAKSSLKRKLKPLYEQSVLDESFSRIEKAKKLWQEIIEKDIKEGYYYQKAQFQLNKYK